MSFILNVVIVAISSQSVAINAFSYADSAHIKTLAEYLHSECHRS